MENRMTPQQAEHACRVLIEIWLRHNGMDPKQAREEAEAIEIYREGDSNDGKRS